MYILNEFFSNNNISFEQGLQREINNLLEAIRQAEAARSRAEVIALQRSLMNLVRQRHTALLIQLEGTCNER